MVAAVFVFLPVVTSFFLLLPFLPLSLVRFLFLFFRLLRGRAVSSRLVFLASLGSFFLGFLLLGLFLRRVVVSWDGRVQGWPVCGRVRGHTVGHSLTLVACPRFL